MYRVQTTRLFDKRLAGLPRQWQLRIMKKLIEVAADPYGKHNNVTKLQGRDGYRLRVGDWRVIYDVDDGSLVLLALELDTRGAIY